MSIQTITQNAIQYHILKTEHKDFVTGSCVIPMGVLYADYKERHIPSLLASMLKLGTQSKTEEVLNELLESKGIQMWSSASDYGVKMGFTCLTKHLDETIALIAEQLASPKLDKTAFERLQQRMIAQYSQLKDDTGYQAQVAYSQSIFPKKHMGYYDSPNEMIALIEKTSIEDIREYHKNHSDFSKAIWVLVGDVPKNAQAVCEKYMPTDEKNLEIKRPVLDVTIKASSEKVLIKDKQSVDFVMGHVIDIDRKHPDYIPLMLGLDALGGSFSARLMRTVRDEDGLTYNVGSSLGFGLNSQCFWVANGSFAPKLLDQGIKAIEHQLNLWVDKGLTQEELSERKSGLVGKYQVRLSDASVLASKLAGNLEQGFEADYLYSFCQDVEKTTLEDVNRVIKEYIHLDKATRVSAGSI